MAVQTRPGPGRRPRRRPLPFRQWDSNACESCALTQAAWMLGFGPRPTRKTMWGHTDKILGRPPGQPAPPCSGLRYLLRHGCEVASYGPEMDLARLRRDGYPYLRGFFTGSDIGCERDWTPARIEWIASYNEARRRKYRSLLTRYGDTLTSRPEAFTIGEAKRLVGDGWLVLAMVDGTDRHMSHMVLLYGWRNGAFEAYNPNFYDGGLTLLAADTALDVSADAVRSWRT